jgi:hypothetical protein
MALLLPVLTLASDRYLGEQNTHAAPVICVSARS